MPAKRYRVSLSVEEQQKLKGLVSRDGRQHINRPTPGSCCLAMKIKNAGR